MRWLCLLFLTLAAGCGPVGPVSVLLPFLLGKKGKETKKGFSIATKTLPKGEVNVSYNCQLTATSGTQPYTWSDVNNTLQTYGLTLDPNTGEITGTPTQSTGASGVTVTIKVTDANSKTAQKDFTLVICPELQITTTTLPDAYDGQTEYNATLTATDGTGSYTWQIVSGSLPPNLNFDASGLISGDIASNTSANSPYNFTVEVTDGIGTKQANLSITVWQQLQITTTSLPDGYEGQTGYSVTLTATGGTGTYTWSITSGTLPSNLNWDAATATISGDIDTGTATDYPLEFEVTDGIQTAAANLTLTVHPELQITTSSLPDAYEGVSYSYTVTASGGNAANYNWSISGQPSWLFIDSSTGKLSGTPPANSAGTYTFTVTVTDGLQTASKQFDLTVNVQLVADFEATPTQGKAPLDVTFTDLSTGNPTSWEWDFDNDGTPDSTVQNPTHTYSNPGWYTVKLTISNGANSDTCVKEKYILVYSNVYYVNGLNGDDTKSGLDWGNAWKTIGHALSQAGDYDLVLVADATYKETNLDFGGKKIHLKGVDRNTAGARPIIDCQSSGRAFYFASGETKDSVIDNFIIRNGSADNGGAIYCDGSSPSIINCTFSNNSANNYGGVIYCLSSSPTVDNCIFSGNSTTTYFGGAICCYTDSNPSITNCTFSSNSANGSGTNSRGGAIFCFPTSNPRITNCTFSSNSANEGGAIYCFPSSSPSITNCIFSGNTAGVAGGAIYCYSGSPTVTNCTFSGNSASAYGGAIFCSSDGSPTLNNCILWGNNASTGGDEIYIYDSISSCTLNYCCVDNTGYGFASGVPTTTIDDSNNCIHSDPKFACADVGVLRLKHDSPCIDAGNSSLVPAGVTTDIMGCSRIVGSAVDIGAYEVQGIVYVDGVGGDDTKDGLGWATAKKTIGAGLGAADDGWIVVVADATYNETDLNFNGKKIYLKGVDYHNAGARPVIDCQSYGRAFYFHSGETKDSIVDNFTIKNGSTVDGGAICCENSSSPTVTNCMFSDNKATFSGGAIYCTQSSPSITNCTFSGNSAGSYSSGGAICCCNSSSPSIINCTFSDNSAGEGGAICSKNISNPTIINCTFSGNSSTDYSGGAINCASSSNMSIINCTFSSNSANLYGGTIFCYDSGSVTLNNCILWGDSAGSGGDEIYIYDSTSSCTLNYCCVDNTGYGFETGVPTTTIDDSNNCIHEDPRFVDPAGGNYHLKPTSPCIDKGNNTYVPSGVGRDLDGNKRIVDGDGDGVATVDIGAHEFCNIIYVDDATGNDTDDGLSWTTAKKTIQAGIDAASDFWLVLVADGTYTGAGNKDIDFGGKKIYLKGVDHNTAGQRPVIDCQSSGRAFYFGSGETEDSVIDNFVIQNGRVEDTYGGAIVCENNSSPTITNCVFQNNEAADTDGSHDYEYGGAIYSNQSSPMITNCTFSSNSACYGGAIYCGNNSSLTVTNSIFSDNSANYYGGAIDCYSSSSATVTNCTFSNNNTNWYGGAIVCWNSCSATLNNSILWGNSAGSSGDEIYIVDSGSSCTLNYCCVDNTGYGFGGGVPTTTIDDSNNCTFANPQFVDAANGNYHLKSTSPCIDAGNNSYISGVDKDLDGNPRIVNGTVDIGAYEYQP